MKKRLNQALLVLALLSAIILAANLPASIQVGVDGHYRRIRMPLYVKWTQFLARHYEYERLSKEITAGCKTDEEKALAILRWTRENIAVLPAGMPLHDDHILNIIIRGYAVKDQFQDVFTTLCAYSGIPAFYDRAYDNNHKSKYILSFVKLYGKWCAIDAYRGIYFMTKDDRIASVEDIVNDRSLVSGAEVDAIVARGIPYKEYYYNLEPVIKPVTLRADKQMPLQRILFELKKALGLEKEI